MRIGTCRRAIPHSVMQRGPTICPTSPPCPPTAMSAQTGTTSPPAIPIPVLLLKTKSTPNDSYEDYFSRDGRFAPQFVPVLSNTFNAANLQKLRRLLTEGNEGAYLRDGETRYGGMIFTSQRAVEAFAGVVREVGA